MPFLLKCFHKCLGRNRSRDLICISCVRQYVDICKHIMLGSAKSASQRAVRASVRAMRVTRVMRVMRATVQMLRIFICFIYIRVRKFWTNFFLFFFRFCYNFGENFAYSKSPKMRKKNKNNTQKFIKVQDFRKKKSEKNIRLHRYSNRYLLTHVIH